jgi:protease-4
MRRVIGFLLATLVVGAVAYALYTAAPRVPDRGVLVIELAGNLEEAPPLDAVAQLTARGLALPTVLLQLEKAAADRRIVAVLLHVRTLGIGFARIQELRDAVERVQTAGTPVVALLDVASFNATREVYLASAAERTYVTSAHLGPLAGIAGEFVQLGGLMDKIGVRFEYERVGKYKSAPESLTERSMSAPAREVANDILDGVFAQILSGIAAGRTLEVERVRELIDDPPSTAQDYLEAGLADGIASRRDVLKQAGFETAERVTFRDYLGVDPTSLGLRDGPAVALVFGSGPILQNGARLRAASFSARRITEALKQAAESEEVRAIVLRINSGGGSAQASDEIWQAVRAARKEKPVVVSMADAAASGGYYVASAADVIVAEPATLTGSIDVFFARPILTELYKKLDVGTEVIARGSFSEIGTTSVPMTPEMRERARRIVRSLYDDFLARVSTGRNIDTERVDRVGQGRVWLGEQAHDLGLVDEMGGLYAAVARAKLEAGIEPEVDPRRIVLPGPRSLREQFRDLLRSSVATFLAEEVGVPRLPDGLHRWLVALDSPFAYLPEHWIEIYSGSRSTRAMISPGCPGRTATPGGRSSLIC